MNARRVTGLVLLVLAATAAVGERPSTPASAATYRGLVVFSSNRDGDWDAYAVDPARGTLWALTRSSVDERGVLVSPDGAHFAVSRQSARGDVLVGNLAGASLKRLGPGAPAGWSRDGRLLAILARGDAQRLTVVSPDGSRAGPVLSVSGGAIVDVAGFSREGRRIGFEVESGAEPEHRLVVADVRTGRRRVLDTQATSMGFTPAWAPDRPAIAFRRAVDLGDSWTVQILVADLATGEKRVVQAGDGLGPPRWSADGTRLAYTVQADEHHPPALAIADLERLRERRVETAGEASAYEWAPVGPTLAFVDRRGLWTATAAGQVRRIGSGGSGGRLAWAPDGSGVAVVDRSAVRVLAAAVRARSSIVLAARGFSEVAGWVPKRATPAHRAARLPAIDAAFRHELRSRGHIVELVATGARAAAITSASRFDCYHVLVWTPAARAAARADPIAPCYDRPSDGWVGGLRMTSDHVTWSGRWWCGNTECVRINVAANLRGARRLTARRTFESVFFDDAPDVVRPAPERPATAGHPARVGSLTAFATGRRVIVRRPGARVSLTLSGRGPVLVRLTPAGLFYAYTASPPSPGRVRFVSRRELLRRLGA